VERRPKVRVYTTPTCPYCAMAKDFLKKHGVKFEEVDVYSNREAAIEIMTKTGQMGVPVLDIGGEIVVGFDKGAIKRALDIKE